MSFKTGYCFAFEPSDDFTIGGHNGIFMIFVLNGLFPLIVAIKPAHG
jgi:hypothetical protein